MKSIISTALLFCISLVTFSQTTIEGTYLPVKNTRILQVWDTAATTMPIPTVSTVKYNQSESASENGDLKNDACVASGKCATCGVTIGSLTANSKVSEILPKAPE